MNVINTNILNDSQLMDQARGKISHKLHKKRKISKVNKIDISSTISQHDSRKKAVSNINATLSPKVMIKHVKKVFKSVNMKTPSFKKYTEVYDYDGVESDPIL